MNHLFIGLGGTGGSVLRSIRKLMYQNYRDETPEGVFVDYLYVDSDPKAFSDTDPSWSVLGTSLVLGDRNRCKIMETNLATVIGNLQSHPNLRSWLGDRDAWGEILNGLNVDAAGGQKRRLGRFLFAMNAGKFTDSVSRLVGDLRARSNQNALTFHIFCGLAGGTGSGAVIDTIVQLRRMFNDPQRARILVYAYVPDINAPQGWSSGNYHANAYAALRELNALSAGAWMPQDVKDATGPVNSHDWFNGCYIYSDANDQGYRSAIDGDLLEIVADFVFQKIVVAPNVDWVALHKAENAENGDSAPESSTTRLPLRSVRFLSFGIKRLTFPEQMVREYLSYDFASQAFRQLQFNNWQDHLGYIDKAPPEARAAYVADAKQQEGWRVTDDYLTLERPIIDGPAASRWTDYATEWRNWETHYVEMVSNDKEALHWLNELQKLFLATWKESFRKSGVPGFFEIMKRDTNQMAKAVRNRVEQQLFEEWAQGARSLHGCSQTVSALIEELESRLQKIANSIERREAEAMAAQRTVTEIERKWHKLHILGKLSRKRELVKFGNVLRQVYVAKTCGEAARYGRILGVSVIEQLVELRQALAKAEETVSLAAESAEAAMRVRQPRGETVQGNGQGHTTRIEDAEAVRAAREKLVLDPDEQRDSTQQVRSKIVGLLGQDRTFLSLSNGRLIGAIRDVVIRSCEANVQTAHQRLIQDRDARVIGVSIIEKLKTKWGGDQAILNREVTALVRSAGRFITFDNAERNLDFPGRSIDPRAKENFAVMLPAAPDEHEFVEALKSAFTNACGGAGELKIIENDPKRGNEITFVSLVNLFPLRYADLVAKLRTAYERRLAADPVRAALEIHTEGDGQQFPSLFLADAAEVEARARPILMLSEGLGLITQQKSFETGKTSLIMMQKDQYGIEEPITIGADLVSAARDFDEARLDQMRASLKTVFGNGTVNHADTKEAVRKKILDRLNAIVESRGGDAADRIAGEWRTAARTAIDMLERKVDL